MPRSGSSVLRDWVSANNPSSFHWWSFLIMPRSRSSTFLRWLAMLAAAVATGCAASTIPAGSPSAQLPPGKISASMAATSQANELNDDQRLEQLWHERTRDNLASDFTLGPGDLLEISVPLEQLEHREVRVSSADNIELPLAGVVSVRGMNEQQLIADLRRRLSKYMYDPPVSLFVKQYGSREVAVVGAVQKPGIYTLTSRSETLMDMISKAGGTASGAASTVIFVPAESGGAGLPQSRFARIAPDRIDFAQVDNAGGGEPGETSLGRRRETALANAGRVGAIEPIAAEPENPIGAFLSPQLARMRPITISTIDPQTQRYLEIPARPGDVLLVASAGEVTVGGWVQNPGAYKVTPGMTALSAISAAGGAMFSSSAEVLRTGISGERVSIPVNIPAVQKGEQGDVSMQSGDVVVVDRSAAGAIPYAAYELFSKFGSGMMFPIP
jgi:protein involved in polysaccharide export with SLBB domain